MKNKKVLLSLVTVFLVIILSLLYFSLNKIGKESEDNISNSQTEDIFPAENVSETASNTLPVEENAQEEPIIQKEPEVEKVPISYTAAVPIYMYHWVRDDTGDYPWPENMVRPSTLTEQIKYLVSNNYDLIWITDLEKIYKYEKPVALTFDDGWLDVYLYMFPLAKQYNIKYSMYIIKDMVGTPGYCDEAQLKEMQASGLVDIQSHTVTHPYLAQLSYEKQKNELFNSKEYLKETYGINSTVICYPYGSRNNNTIELSKEAGYIYGLDMDGGVYYTAKHIDPLKIPRIYATRSMSLDTFVNYASKAHVEVEWE